LLGLDFLNVLVVCLRDIAQCLIKIAAALRHFLFLRARLLLRQTLGLAGSALLLAQRTLG
jgi:hypothetical protein